jgi:hypothetical protein
MRLTDWDRDLIILGQARDYCKMHQIAFQRRLQLYCPGSAPGGMAGRGGYLGSQGISK